jgi:hypothetical protein
MLNRQLIGFAGLSCLMVSLGCAPGGGSGKTIQTARIGDQTVTLANASGQMAAGKNDLTITVQGEPPAATASLKSMRFSMPAMGTMAAMSVDAVLQPMADPHVFKGTVDLPMNGAWQTTVIVENGKGPHRAIFSVLAR